MTHHSRAWAMERIIEGIETVRLPSGVILTKGGFTYPACGHRPVDFKVIGFGMVGTSDVWMTSYGYHIAKQSNGRRNYMTRGFWPIEDCVINEGISGGLDDLIQSANALFELDKQYEEKSQ